MTVTDAPSPYFPIKGIAIKDAKGDFVVASGVDVEVPLRQNIDTWSNDHANDKQVKLFVKALSEFQKIDPSKRESYFQIAGIHGQPNVPWDEPHTTQEEANLKGYCTHNNVLFPIWHRAYLALYEQRISEIMAGIVKEFTVENKEEWEDAARLWRLPFWDWGLTTSVPNLSKWPTAIVPTKDGSGEEAIQNPLYQFRMPNNKPMSSQMLSNFTDPWVDQKDTYTIFECIGTSRWPQEGDNVSGSEAWKNGVVNNYKVQDALKKPQWVANSPYGQPSEMVWRLLTVPMEYSTFATTAQLDPDQNVANDINIEYIHNNIHGWVGGDLNGHMSQIPVASFDPLFWLHHCNIDRIFALWQGLNPDKWIKTDKVNAFFQEIIGLAPGKEIGPETPLRPFHKDPKGTYMVPADVRYPWTLGHTYPELQAWKFEGKSYNSEPFKQSLRKTINDLYGVSRQSLIDATGNIKGVEYLEDSTKSVDFSFSIRYRKYAYGGEPFWIRIYFRQDAEKMNATTDLITEVYNFSQSPEDKAGKLACSNCKDQKKLNIRSTASISLTPILISLLKSGKDLPSLSKADVLKYIQSRAYWRVFKHNVEVPRALLDPLDLEIIGNTNDSTQFNDPTKAPLLENFKAEPTITGGADGALDPSLKQPVVPLPPVLPSIPKANLKVNSHLPFQKPLAADAVVILDSASLNLTPAKITGNGIDNTQVFFTESKEGKGDILFLLSFRRSENQIVLNTLINNAWGKEVRVPLENRFKGTTPSILIHDQGDGYEVFVDWRHLVWFEKRAKDKTATSVSYSVNESQSPVLGTALKVKVYGSMKEVFHH
ncbi:hypothetical protein N7490_002419 [Penicillium lividum]|nr:hypothetical protein N7490_002419 [Penicillium lividum]